MSAWPGVRRLGLLSRFRAWVPIINPMAQLCSNCLQDVEEGLDYESRSGQPLCGPCYFALWGAAASPRGSVEESLRPQARRPQKQRGSWMAPGPTGELAVTEQVRRKPRRHGC